MCVLNVLGLERHATCHSDSRPFACTECPMQFKRAQELRKHMTRHQREAQENRQLELQGEGGYQSTVEYQSDQDCGVDNRYTAGVKLQSVERAAQYSVMRATKHSDGQYLIK